MLYFEQNDSKRVPITIASIRKKLRSAYEAIKTATSYTEGYLKHGSGCDSTSDAKFRMQYVIAAEKLFVEAHKNEILNLALELVQNDLDEFNIRGEDVTS